MCEKETNIGEDRTIDTNEKVLILISEIMSDFTDVVKMLTETMDSQISVIKEQEKNSIEMARLNNQTINRQLDIIQGQNEFLSKIFDMVDEEDAKKLSKVVEMYKTRKQSL